MRCVSGNVQTVSGNAQEQFPLSHRDLGNSNNVWYGVVTFLQITRNFNIHFSFTSKTSGLALFVISLFMDTGFLLRLIYVSSA